MSAPSKAGGPAYANRGGSFRWLILLGSFVLMGFVGWVDYITGSDATFTLFYLLPIAAVANGAGIWMVRRVPTVLFYRITYVLLLLLGTLLLWRGLSHVIMGPG